MNLLKPTRVISTLVECCLGSFRYLAPHFRAITSDRHPYRRNITTRRYFIGFINKNVVFKFQIVNQHLLKDLTELGVWDDDMKNLLIAHNGSVQVNLFRLFRSLQICFCRCA